MTSPAPRSPATPVEPPALPAIDGDGGASADAEFRRRHHSRQERVLLRHPRLGKVLLAAFDDPQSTRAWSSGAEGERKVAEILQPLAGESLRVLHDRRIPGSRANIDHLVICPTGVLVVDAKRYRGARPERRLEGGFIRAKTESLYLDRRNRTNLVDGVTTQVARVSSALAGQPEVAVRGILCFVDADWPLLGAAFDVAGVLVLSPKKLRKVALAQGPLAANDIADLQWLLHQAFPRAHR